MTRSSIHTRNYDTQIDQCRIRYGIDLLRWSSESGIDRRVLGRYRAGLDEPTERNLAKLVQAARRITGQQIPANEFFDLGEDEPLGPRRERRHQSPGRKAYETRFDQCLLREDVLPIDLAREVGLSRQTVFKKRSGVEAFSIGILARLVRGMRRLGRDVRAADLVDVGED